MMCKCAFRTPALITPAPNEPQGRWGSAKGHFCYPTGYRHSDAAWLPPLRRPLDTVTPTPKMYHGCCNAPSDGWRASTPTPTPLGYRHSDAAWLPPLRRPLDTVTPTPKMYHGCCNAPSDGWRASTPTPTPLGYRHSDALWQSPLRRPACAVTPTLKMHRGCRAAPSDGGSAPWLPPLRRPLSERRRRQDGPRMA